jgi:IS30 family transposase
MPKHLDLGQRYRLSINQSSQTQKELAAALGVSASTISRELKRNQRPDGSYDPQWADKTARKRRTNQPSKRKIKGELKAQVEGLLRQDYSPEQVRGTLFKQHQVSVSVQGIYNYIWREEQAGGDLYTHLRLGRKYRKKYGKVDKRKRAIKYKNKPSIETRPTVVEDKTRLGDWEGDTIEGANKSGYIITLTERVSKTTYLIPVAHKTKAAVKAAIVKRLKKSPLPVHTLTLDNGTEFDDYKQIAKALKCEIYFAHPYSPWERGLNENTNGLIRQYFPKQMDFSKINKKDTDRVEKILNNRPRKKLDYSTPNEIVKRYILNPKIAFQT